MKYLLNFVKHQDTNTINEIDTNKTFQKNVQVQYQYLTVIFEEHVEL